MTDGVRDPAIKLFGRAIPLPESPDPGPADCEKEICAGIASTEAKDPMPDALKVSDQDESGSSTGLINDNEDENQTVTLYDKAAADSKTEQDPSEADGLDQEKVLKKPDKLLPCPRCKSLNTKFCYYNNYNVNQPRHFCKNCQRYWTAGGAMRNVPVGAGRRKNKHHRHVMMLSGGFPCTRADGLNSPHLQVSSAGLSAPVTPLTGNETLLKFGPEATSSALNLGDEKRNTENGSVVGGETREEPSCASTVTVSNCVDNDLSRVPVNTEKNGLPGGGLSNVHHLRCFPGASWSYPWGLGWNNVASISAGHCSSELVHGPENGSPNPILWGSSPMLATPAFCAPSIPFPFMPASFWGCIPGWPNGTWNLPCVGSNVGLLPFSFQSNRVGSGNGSPTLGKHSREAILHGDEKTEKKSLWIPKTLRIDHPDEAAKSSIWATLGIKLDESMKKGGIFKSFHSQTESKGHTSSAAEILLANPAALSRSQTFQEST